MLVYKKHIEIDKQKWDACLLQSRNGLIFGCSFYLDAVCNQWDALIWNDYEAVFPITRNSKIRVHYFFNPIFALQLGVFSKIPITQKLLESFFIQIPAKIKLIDIYLNEGNQYRGNQFITSNRVCQQIDLTQPYEQISIHYSTNLKRNLVKARKNNLEIVLSKEGKSVVSLFRENGGESIKDITALHFDRLENLMDRLIERKLCKIYECWCGKELLAAACFSFFNNRLTYIKGGSTDKGRDLGAMHLIMDEVIHLNVGKDLQFDFGGSSIPAIQKFNKNFGAKNYKYQRLYRNHLSFIFKIFKK
jgi:hypothetical protein